MSSPKKSLGQHWLRDEDILAKIVEDSKVGHGDNVLEVGPGQGTLTSVLLEEGATVTAVEYDAELYEELRKSLNHPKLNLVHNDILKFDLTKLPEGYHVVANIPYYLTSNLVRLFCESSNPPASINLLVQKEVAERICAKPGQMSLLSVSAQTYYDAELGIVVDADKFIPPPKVDSQVVHLIRKPNPLVDQNGEKLFFRVVKAGFSNRRKTILNSLSGGLNMSKPEASKLLKKSDINPTSRPQELSLNQWKILAANTEQK